MEPDIELGFQSPSGDSRVATPMMSPSWWMHTWEQFQSPSGDSRVATCPDEHAHVCASYTRFQSPSGDSRVATRVNTWMRMAFVETPNGFQSPSGDSRVATRALQGVRMLITFPGFSPLPGIRGLQQKNIMEVNMERILLVVSVPFRGFEGCNLTHMSRGGGIVWVEFQSPSGDSRVATTGKSACRTGTRG